jgi:ribosomal protein S18 acetylase RimI-like enzyme
MIQGEEKVVSELIRNVFQRYIASEYNDEGIQEFNEYIEPNNLLKRIADEGYILITAKDEETIAGVIGIRDKSHISLLFVSEEYQQRGIARALLQKGIEAAEKAYGKISDLTVNSSPYAVEIYIKLGFKVTGKEQEKNGIRYIPMIKIN